MQYTKQINIVLQYSLHFGWFCYLMDLEVYVMYICNCCFCASLWTQISYNWTMTAILCVCASLWFDNLYGGFVTFLSLRPFHLLYPLSLSSMETFIQSLFAFPFGESFFIVICRISHPSLLTQSFRNCQIWSTVHHFKYLLIKCRSGLIGCDDLSGRLNIICPKTCPVSPNSTPPMATLDFDPLRTTTMGIRTALHYDDFLQRTVKLTVFICIQYICDNRTSVGLVHHMQGMLHCMILKYQVVSSCILPFEVHFVWCS